MATNYSGSRIFIDNSTNNLILKLGTSGEAIELSSNKVIIYNDIEILGNINNTDYQNLLTNVGSITSQINKEAVPNDDYQFSVKIVENEYHFCTDEEIIEDNYLCDLMIKSKYKLEWEGTDSPCDAENIYFSTLEDAIAEAMTQSI